MCELPGILAEFTIEMMPKETASLAGAIAAMPRPRAIFVPYLAEETDDQRVAAAVAIRKLGLVPVPHISARRMRSADELDSFLAALRQEAGVDSLFVIAGDLPHIQGPYHDTTAVIRSGLLQKHAIRKVGIAGHPDDHPDVATPILWAALEEKTLDLHKTGIETEIVTQFSFDAAAVLLWLRQLRDRGIEAPVRIGIPGPASIKLLMGYARRCGVRASGKALAKYGLSLSRLVGKAGPEAFLAELEDGLAPEATGTVHAHMFPFGGFSGCAHWLNEQKPRKAAA